MDHKKYLIIIEHSEDGSYSAYAPDLPGCVAVGQDSAGKAKQLMQEAIEAHIQGMLEDGEAVPEPTTEAEYVVT